MLKTFCQLSNFESTQMVAAIVWRFPMCTQLGNCAADDIVPSVIRLKKHESKMKFLVSVFWKLDQTNI